MLDRIAEIRSFVHGMDFEKYNADPKTRSAVQYGIFIISEASIHLPDVIKDQFPEIPWTKIRGVRNILAHGYFLVDQVLIWEIVTDHLNAMEAALRRLNFP